MMYGFRLAFRCLLICILALAVLSYLAALLFSQCYYVSSKVAKPRQHGMLPVKGQLSDYRFSHHEDYFAQVADIDRKLRQCFTSLHMEDMLNNDTFWIKAKADAINVINMLQSVLPPQLAMTSDKSMCWNITFIASLGNDGILRGSVGKHLVYVEFDNDKSFEDPRQYYRNMLKAQTGISSSEGLYQDIVCIPRVFLAGYPKSGSTALDDLLTVHPKIHHGLSKEPKWWVPSNFDPNVYTFRARLDYFVKYALQYQYKFIDKIHFEDMLLLDSSPNLLSGWSNVGYGEIYEDVCLMPVVFSILIPSAQFVVILRDPIEFLYSHFWFRCSSKVFENYNLTAEQTLRGPHVFHEMVTKRVTAFRKCSQEHSIEECVYQQALLIDNHDTFPCGQTPLGIAIYYVHVMRWFSLFPRTSFHFVVAEEFFQSPFSTAEKIWHFLGLSQPTLNYTLLNQRLRRGRNKQVQFDYRKNRQLQMLPRTRVMLKRFFSPFNVILSTLLSNEQYQWNQKEE